MNNLELYEKFRSVPKEAQKSFNNGRFSGTDINPMWRIKKLTEEFGPVGFGWYYMITNQWLEKSPDGTEIAGFCNINLYVKYNGEWSMGIQGTGGSNFVRVNKNDEFVTSDEVYKMALTDAISVACKALGIGADIYFEKDTTKYTQVSNDEIKPKEIITCNCEKCGEIIKSSKTKNGILTAEEVARRTKAKFGHVLCIDCAKEINETMPPTEIVDEVASNG